MRKLSILAAVLALSALVVPAGAAWTWENKTADWALKGLPGGGWGMVDDGTTLYAFNGADAKKYDASSDSWSDLTSATRAAYATSGGQVYSANGNIYMTTGGSYFSVFDPTGNAGAGSWAQIDIDLGGSTHSWTQGSLYNPETNKWFTCWSDVSGPEKTFYNAYDFGLATPAWEGAYEVTPYTQWPIFTRPMPGVIAEDDGTEYYWKLSNSGATPTMQRAALDDWSDDPLDATTENMAQAAFTADLSQVYGNRILAVLDGKIYVTGGDLSYVFAVYDIAADEWTNLDDHPARGAYCNQSMASLNGAIYMQANQEYWVATIPEPATMALLAFGGIGLLIRRRRRS